MSNEIAHSREIFDRLTRIADRAFGLERYDTAAAFAQVAAGFASTNHAGIFASPLLESIVAGIGATLPAESATRRRRSNGWPQRVLHVLTEAIGVGGHTRFALRWLQQDEGRTHWLALTRQRRSVPPALAQAVESRNGQMRAIQGGGNRSLVTRAAELRQLAMEFDVVVLYTHPYDAVAAIALSGVDERPAVAFVNHADHAFWLGSVAADVVANIRAQGVRLCVDRRGIAADRCSLLPIPLDHVAPRYSREEAKGLLALPPSTTVILTVAAPYKYECIDGTDFLDLVTPVLAANDRAVLLAVGPKADGRWRSANRQTGGRIRACGQEPDVRLYYEACDIYLDSYPVSSVTSALEAASYGVPVITLCPYQGSDAVLCSEDLALEDLATRVSKPGDFASLLEHLLADPLRRHALGTKTAEHVRDVHSPESWRRALEDLYLRLGDLSQGIANLRALPEGHHTRLDLLDDLLSRMMAQPLLHPGLIPSVYRQRDTLQPVLRRWMWVSLLIDQGGRRFVPTAVRHWLERGFMRVAEHVTI